MQTLTVMGTSDAKDGLRVTTIFIIEDPQHAAEIVAEDLRAAVDDVLDTHATPLEKNDIIAELRRNIAGEYR